MSCVSSCFSVAARTSGLWPSKFWCAQSCTPGAPGPQMQCFRMFENSMSLPPTLIVTAVVRSSSLLSWVPSCCSGNPSTILSTTAPLQATQSGARSSRDQPYLLLRSLGYAAEERWHRSYGWVQARVHWSLDQKVNFLHQPRTSPPGRCSDLPLARMRMARMWMALLRVSWGWARYLGGRELLGKARAEPDGPAHKARHCHRLAPARLCPDGHRCQRPRRECCPGL